jgi:hypothetical protein
MAEGDPAAGTTTLLEGESTVAGAGESTEATTPITGDWKTLVPEALRPRVEKFKDVGTLAKSYAELESAAGSMVRIPAENASP